jgi:hypothetical protein
MGTKIENGLKMCEALLRIMGKSAKTKVLGKEVKIGDFKDTLDELNASHEKVIAAHAAYIQIAAAHRALAVETGFERILVALTAQLRTMLTPEELAACGIVPNKRRALNADERALANVKTRTTRAANGVVGKKQRRVRETQEGLAAAYGSEPASPPPVTAPPDEGAGRPNGAGGANGVH